MVTRTKLCGVNDVFECDEPSRDKGCIQGHHLKSRRANVQPGALRFLCLVNTGTESMMWTVNGILEPDITWIVLMEKKTDRAKSPAFVRTNDRTSEVKLGKSQRVQLSLIVCTF